MFTGMNVIDFNKKFLDKESCYLYLEELKWGKVFSVTDAATTNITKASISFREGVRVVHTKKV